VVIEIKYQQAVSEGDFKKDSRELAGNALNAIKKNKYDAFRESPANRPRIALE
jgi:hypothetical protein